MAETKVWTKDEIKAKLVTDNRWLLRGILAIYKYQTAVEKAERQTKELNGVGFNAVDAGFLSGMAKLLLEGKGLTDGQIEASRKTMLKYSGQLARIANKKI